MECAATQKLPWDNPSTAEPAAPIGAAMCIKAKGVLAPFSGISLCSVVVMLVVGFPVEGAEEQD